DRQALRLQDPHADELSSAGLSSLHVIACDKREALAQGSEATKQSISELAALWIASLSLSSGAHSRDPLARNDGVKPLTPRPPRD
ncbi:MAG: hypothetical protein ABW175_20755, partial [Bradyrhizobium sp.]